MIKERSIALLDRLHFVDHVSELIDVPGADLLILIELLGIVLVVG